MSVSISQAALLMNHSRVRENLKIKQGVFIWLDYAAIKTRIKRLFLNTSHFICVSNLGIGIAALFIRRLAVNILKNEGLLWVLVMFTYCEVKFFTVFNSIYVCNVVMVHENAVISKLQRNFV